ncbi:hypothetical protein JAAARDRAFT_154035 [Jaapia argillacea MUCL 33604]|uniref:MYND-type domain-containing protein n=1 Tax=Jaapia argillacea MUCL 33604 TaxID=933084 RepID=A0A067PVI5_9AGAM|nr:hypothetical protein JAAARDRAFT_154035 [Jaapia argillacea MUCL 33604]
MRESNFAFPAQNRACVCISSQLYDRRALDTESALPLFNSLTHLVYLTSTSPRIREIMTMDGGLERLVRILHNFCISPPPPENPALLYGLTPPNYRPPKPAPTLNPATWDKHAAYRFSLAFQSLVNIGVRGSEHIRSRVVQAGTLDVVGMILEAWLASKGFAVGPSTSATGMPRETREQRLARRAAIDQRRLREHTTALTQALERQVALDRIERVLALERAPMSGATIQNVEDVQMFDPVTDITSQLPSGLGPSNPVSITDPPSSTASDTSTDTSTNSTPAGSGTPTGTVVVPGRERSGTIIARPVWDATGEPNRGRTHRQRERPPLSSTSTSTDNSRPETETEDDGDIDMESNNSRDLDNSPSPEPRMIHTATAQRRAVGIVSDAPPTTTGPSLEVNADAHIIINHPPGGMGGEVVGVEDGIVSLEPNDDFAMGAPPGAPGAIDETPPRVPDAMVGDRPDVTPRAGTMNLPATIPPFHPVVPGRVTGRDTTTRHPGAQRTPGAPRVGVAELNTPGGTAPGAAAAHHHHHHHHRDPDAGPYRDEDVLLSLQLLAYLSKYPHVRQAFYKPRASFHPATTTLPTRHSSASSSNPSASTSGPSTSRTNIVPAPTSMKETSSFFKAFTSATGRGKEKEKAQPLTSPPTSSATAPATSTPSRHTNVFSLVERFTFRPSSSEADLPNPPPTLPPEIQYWAGVIMRNACRKDDSRGGIRQCANMLCGKWESYPREFAKCRRCRKAKYCGKECQSTAWSEGHRFWCSAKDGDDDPETAQAAVAGVNVTAGGTVTGRAERRAERERERERQARERTLAMGASAVDTVQVARAVANAFRSTATHNIMNPNAALPDIPTPGGTWEGDLGHRSRDTDTVRRARPGDRSRVPIGDRVDLSPVHPRRRAETMATPADLRTQQAHLRFAMLPTGTDDLLRDGGDIPESAVGRSDDDMVIG